MVKSMNKDVRDVLLIGSALLIMVVSVILIDGISRNWKTNRQICEENGGTYVETYMKQDSCIYNRKGATDETN